MKKIKLLLLTLVFTGAVFSQQNQQIRSADMKISVVSKNRDTLWLINDDLGKLIASTWELPKYKGKKPKIIMVKVLPIHYNCIENDERKDKKKFKG